jgi:hypothetical protein
MTEAGLSLGIHVLAVSQQETREWPEQARP